MISLAVRCLARSSPASRRPTSVDTAFSMFAAIMPKDPQLNCGHPLRTHSSEFVQSRIEGYLSDDLPLRHTVGLTMYSIRVSRTDTEHQMIGSRTSRFAFGPTAISR